MGNKPFKGGNLVMIRKRDDGLFCAHAQDWGADMVWVSFPGIGRVKLSRKLLSAEHNGNISIAAGTPVCLQDVHGIVEKTLYVNRRRGHTQVQMTVLAMGTVRVDFRLVERPLVGKKAKMQAL